MNATQIMNVFIIKMNFIIYIIIFLCQCHFFFRSEWISKFFVLTFIYMYVYPIFVQIVSQKSNAYHSHIHAKIMVITMKFKMNPLSANRENWRNDMGRLYRMEWQKEQQQQQKETVSNIFILFAAIILKDLFRVISVTMLMDAFLLLHHLFIFMCIITKKNVKHFFGRLK